MMDTAPIRKVGQRYKNRFRNVPTLRSGHSGVGSFGTSQLMDVGLTILLDRGMQEYQRGGNGQVTSLPLKIYCIGIIATT
jgi:hypothetical protein